MGDIMKFESIVARIKEYFTPENEDIYSSKNLNPLERGLLQKIFVFIVYTLSITVLALGLEWFDKYTFLKILSSAELQEKIPQDVLRLFARLIDARNDTDFVHLIIFGLFCGLFVFWLMRHAAGLQWSKAVKLEHAVEFRQAMEKIGITDPDDGIDFVRKHGFPVYIAIKPFAGMEMDNVKARYYAFAENIPVGSRAIFNTYIGNQRLCVDGGDFAILQQKFGREAQAALEACVASLEDTIAKLRSELSVRENRIEQLKKDNAGLTDENEMYKNKFKTIPGREKKSDRREDSKCPFRRVAYPLVNRLITHALPGEKYTRTQIQDAFMRELSGYPELEDPIRQLLHTTKKEAENTPFDLDGWAMEEIRNALGEYVQTDPGRKK